MGACPPATTIASKSSTRSSATDFVFSTSASSVGVAMKPMLTRSEAEYPLASRGSL